MRIVRLILWVLLVIVLLVGIGGFGLYWDTTRAPLPMTRGTLDIAGINADVEILRDQWGIPHIYASNTHDLFFAQGFAHAQDRWWQMEFFRHIGSGSLQELTGKSSALMGTDVFIRTAGWRRSAERDATELSAEARLVLDAFTAGINAYLTSRSPAQLALEYRILGVTGVNIPIVPWTVTDTLVWGKVMAWNLTDSYSRELTRQELFTTLGDIMTNDYLPPYPYDSPTAPTIVRAEDLPINASTLGEPGTPSAQVAPLRLEAQFANRMAGGTTPGSEIPGFASIADHPDLGSNNWVTTGSMSETRMARLSNDTHLAIQMPSIWFTVGLHCLPITDACPYDVVGFALPPAPGVIIGHNGIIAWGITNVGADVQDLYVLEWNPENPLQYRWDGEWRDATLISETIQFGDGEAPITIQVRETHLGPVINDNDIDADTGEILGFNTTDPLVLRWTGFEINHQTDAILGLAQAQGWEDFRSALRLFDIPSQNFVYADVRGNIGYQTPGLMPIRPADHDGLTPYPASSDADVWKGFIPFDDLPRILNPERNYIATANQAVVPLAYYDQLAEKLGTDANYQFSEDWAYGQRGFRINQLLEESAPNDAYKFWLIQTDTKDITAESMLPYIRSIQMEPGNVTDIRNFMVSWDSTMRADSGQAAIFAYFTRRLVANIFNDQLPESVRASNRQLYVALQLMAQPDNIWWDDSTTPDTVETRDTIIIRSLTEAAIEIERDLGSNPAEWRWGDLHGMAFVNQPLGLSGIDLIEDMVNRRVTGYGGGNDTVNASSWDASGEDFFAVAYPSERIIIDMANLDDTTIILPSGQSGHPFSANYDDMIPLYRDGNSVPLPFSRTIIENTSVNRLVLRAPGS